MTIIPPVGAAPIAPIAPSAGAAATNGTTATGFASTLDAVQQLEAHADTLATQVATGQIQDISQFMVATTKANLAVELTVAVRNRAIEAYQEIMRMQV